MNKFKHYLIDKLDDDELHEHVTATYRSLRSGLGYLALALPIVVVLSGLTYGISWQPSISDYYFALPKPNPSTPVDFSFPVRVAFVGGLCAIGVGLYLYKGFTRLENWLLNLAGIFAAGVAFIPMHKPPFNVIENINFHALSAVALFACMALVCWLCAKDTLHLVENENDRIKYQRKYNLYGVLMFLFPLLGIAVNYFFFDTKDRYIYFIEAAGVWIFALYWLTKSRELAASNADSKMRI